MIDANPERGAADLEAQHDMAGYIYLESGEYAKAIEHLTQADPDDPFHQLLLARAYDKAGELQKAKETYKKIDRDAKQYHRARIVLSRSRAQTGPACLLALGVGFCEEIRYFRFPFNRDEKGSVVWSNDVS